MTRDCTIRTFLLAVTCAFCGVPSAAQTTALAPVAQAPATEAAVARAQEPEQRPRLRLTWEDQPTLRIGNVVRIDLRLRLQADWRSSEATVDVPSGLVWSRRRIGFEGEVGKVLGFQIERDLAAAGPWRDVYVNYQQFDSVQIQAGQFKLPFSLDETTSVANLDFVMRSRLADQLAPSRDPGLMVHGRLLSRRLTYEAGLFRHDGDNARRRNVARVYGGRTVAARVTARPGRTSKSVANALDVGAAFVSTDVPVGFSSLEGETAFGLQFYEPDVWVRGPLRRAAFELRWRPGPFSVKSEFVRLTSARRGQSIEGTDLSSLLATGWYVSGTWILTGESKMDGLSPPRRSVLRGGPGAIELAARIEQLQFSSQASGELPSTGSRANVVLGNRLRVFTAGANWYPERWFKVQVNAIRESIQYPDQGPSPGRPAYWSGIVRLQVAF
jgi:phosphate-selective porin OprO/OprP